MSSSTLITDYLGYGTHSARPASPPLPTGGIGMYYETDTQSLFVWNGSAWVSPYPTLFPGVNLTTQSSSISATNLLASPVAGLYRASGAIQLTTAGTSGTVLSSINYNDINGTSLTDTLVPNVTFGTITNRGTGSLIFWAGAGAAIKYSTTVASPVGGPVYAVEFALEKIG